jgi:hypothetical protein
MRIISIIYKLLVLSLFATTSLIAADAVDFNANAVTKALYRGVTFHFVDAIPTITSSTGQGYTGQAIYCAFQSTGEGLLAVCGPDDAGLKIRWNADTGTPGDHASGLFLFKHKDFLNGLNSGPVALMDGHETVIIRFGYMNPGKLGPNQPVAVASLRLVIKDDRGYHISKDYPVESGGELTLKATKQVYFKYDPVTPSMNEAGTRGEASVPSFRNVEFLGFRVDAVRGSQTTAGSNVGVVEFSVGAARMN